MFVQLISYRRIVNYFVTIKNTKMLKLLNNNNIMKVKFAPLHMPLHRRLETLGMAAAFLTLLCGGLVGAILLLYMIFYTSYWLEAVIYILWIYIIDIDICDKGGRRVEWVRSWSWWKYLVEYFPVRMHLTSKFELDPTRNYLFGCFPHGILPATCFGAFSTHWAGFQQLFPYHTPYQCTLKQNFLFPVVRELFLAVGFCSVTKDSLNYLLGCPKGGNVAALLVGGAAESFNAKPGTHRIVLKSRKGFVKIALTNGSPLVPVYSFGETDTYDQVNNPEGSVLRNCQEWIKNKTGIAPPIACGRGFFQYSFGILPLRVPLNMVVGEPIEVQQVKNPSQEQIDKLHTTFTEKLILLFDDNKRTFLKNWETAQLIID